MEYVQATIEVAVSPNVPKSIAAVSRPRYFRLLCEADVFISSIEATKHTTKVEAYCPDVFRLEAGQRLSILGTKHTTAQLIELGPTPRRQQNSGGHNLPV